MAQSDDDGAAPERSGPARRERTARLVVPENAKRSDADDGSDDGSDDAPKHPRAQQILTLSAAIGWVVGVAPQIVAALTFPPSDLTSVLTIVGVVVGSAAGLAKLTMSSDLGKRDIVKIVGAAAVIVCVLIANNLWDDRRYDELLESARGPDLVTITGSVDVTGDVVAGGATDVRLDVGTFGIEPFEVTNNRFRDCVEADECDDPEDGGRFADGSKGEWPVAGVSPDEAHEFCEWIGRDLMTEEQYLAAARGTDVVARPWPWGTELPDRGRANLSYLDADQLPPPIDGDVPPPIPEDLESGEDFGTSGPPVDQGQPVAVTELGAGRTPGTSGVAHLVGNVWEITSTSPEICPNRLACSSPWAPGDSGAATLVIRGQSYTTPFINGQPPGPNDATIALDPPLREPDIGFRCTEQEPTD